MNLGLDFFVNSMLCESYQMFRCSVHLVTVKVHVPNFGGLSRSEDRGGGDNTIQFINFGRVGDKSFKEWRQKIGGWKGG